MDLGVQKKVALEDGAGRTWVFSGPVGRAERWLRHVSMPAGFPPAGDELRDPDAPTREVLRNVTGTGSGRTITVAGIIQAMDNIRMARAEGIDHPTCPVDESEQQLLAS